MTRRVQPTHTSHLLVGHLLRQHDDAAVALDGGGEREADAGVARGRLDDGVARLQHAALLRVLDHAQRDPVLDAAARVEELTFGH